MRECEIVEVTSPNVPVLGHVLEMIKYDQGYHILWGYYLVYLGLPTRNLIYKNIHKKRESVKPSDRQHNAQRVFTYLVYIYI
jgi:hypothetical protein